MPANLPPQYFEAEKRLRLAKDPADKILILEEMLGIMPKHKGTDHLKAELRGKIAKLTQTLGKKTGAHRASMMIEKEGAAQVVVTGLPNAGKSQLIASVTNAVTTVAEYPFTTTQPLPGMMEFLNIKIQLIDTPPLVPQAIEFWLPHMIRRADGLLIVVDLTDKPLAQLETIIAQLAEMKTNIGIGNADEEIILSRQKALIVGNKLDLENAAQNYTALQKKYQEHIQLIGISAKTGTGLEELKLKTFQMLDIMRVYTKTPGQKSDLNDPIILKRGSNLENAATEVHKDFAANLKYARIWGSGKHNGIMIKRDHVLQDGDIIELHL